MAIPRRTLAAFTAACAVLVAAAGAADAQAALTVSSPADGAYTNSRTPLVTFAGATPNARVAVEADGIYEGSILADANGSGSLHPNSAIATTPRQVVTLNVREVDSGVPSAPIAVHVDQVPLIAGTGDGTSVAAGDVHFDASAAIPGMPVYLILDGDDGIAQDYKIADAGGRARLSPVNPLPPGHHTAYLRTEDALIGTVAVSDASDVVHFDVRPGAPAFAQLYDGEALNQSRPPVQVSGVDPAATSVTLYDAGGAGTPQEIGRTTAISPGHTATIVPSAGLADGTHTLVVTQTVNGVESAVDAGAIRVGITAAAPSLDAPADGLVTSHDQPWFEVSGALRNHWPGDGLVGIDLDGHLAATYARSDSDGHAAFQLTSPLADGPHTASAVTIDDAGHESTARSATVHFTVDTTAPDEPTIVSPQRGSSWTDPRPSVIVHTEPGARVHLLVDETDDEGYRTADAQGDVTFPLSRALDAGVPIVWVFARDAAGNDSPDTPAQPPAAPWVPVVSRPGKVTLSAGTLTAKRPVELRFTLPAAGTVRLSLTRTVKGQARTVATVDVRVGHAGKATYTLRTRVGGHTLTKGRYTLTLQTVAGRQRSRTVTRKLTVR